MTDVSEAFRGSDFKVFANILAKDSKAEVWTIPAKGGGSRAFCDRMNSWAQGEGQPGLGYIFWRKRDEAFSSEDIQKLQWQLQKAIEEGRTTDIEALYAKWNQQVEAVGPIAKNLGPERTEAIRRQIASSQAAFGEGDATFFVAGKSVDFLKIAGPARTKLGEELGLVKKDCFELCWIVDFPMYGLSAETGKIEFSHNPFSMPNMNTEEFLALDANDHEKILGLKAIQYDIVCNGVELSSGAIRNHRPEVMKKAFAIAGYPEDVLEKKFGGMLHALSLGAPPHGGIAPGIDRIVMLLAGEENLREVVLFPMNQRAEDLMMGAPSEVTAKQLKELHIRLDLPKK
jgi:aspartyl-tRNA synthetase